MIRIVLIVLLLSGCSSIPSPEERHLQADQLAKVSLWQDLKIQTDQFLLKSYIPQERFTKAHLTIYLEGDGFAWSSRTKVSSDPTPINPVGLKLAVQHYQINGAYLARPCQYLKLQNPKCNSMFWTDARFSIEIIDSLNQGIDALKSRFGAKSISLIGYSGGGAIAALLAAKRTDVTQFVTIAGNLDHKFWTDLHNLSPLKRSLNPPHFWQKLQHVNQIHYVGEKDKVVPLSVYESYVSRFSNDNKITLKIIPGVNHHCCWEDLKL